MKMLCPRFLLALVAALVLTAGPASGDVGPPAIPDLENLISFGDSLSDSGNVLVFGDGGLVAWENYWQGRFSNGPVWTENLSKHMGLEKDFLVARMMVPPFPAAPDPPSLFLNGAFGGAVTGSLPDPVQNSFLNQVQTAVLAGADIPPNSLVTVWIGGNDFRTIAIPPAELIENVVSGTITGMNILVGTLGATHIAVMNMPDGGALPDFNGDAFNAALLRFQTIQFNTALDAALDAFALANPGVVLYKVDAFSMSERISAEKDKFGIINSTDAALAQGKNFTEAEGYVFWDNIHPAASYHALLGAFIFGEIFIQAPDPGVDYFPTKYGSGSAIGLAAQQGQVAKADFLDPTATTETGRPSEMDHGLLQVDLTLPALTTAEFTIYFAEPLPEDHLIFKYTNDQWTDFSDVFATTGGAQGAEISEDRRSAVIRVLDNGEYDSDPVEGQVRDPVAPGLAPAPQLPCFIGAIQ